MNVTIIVPTYNEAPNIAELVRRVTTATRGLQAEILFVDDSTDHTADTVREVAKTAAMPVRLIHRNHASGGLGGAVVVGLQNAHSDVCVVMDGDLQHPPETIVDLVDRYQEGGVDVVVASRYVAEGSSEGLSGGSRVLVSRGSTMLTKAMFPIRLKDVSDPMTGFFLVDRRALDIDNLKPLGFKILLEILARKPLRVAEIPFVFAGRHAGESKASMKQGFHFLAQLALLRFGKMSLFAVIGVVGALANLAIMWVLQHYGMNYILAAIIASVLTIVGNFVLQERYVFQDMKGEASGVWSRFAKSFAFNGAEAIIRIPIIALLVNTWHIVPVIAAGITLIAAFVVRFLFHSLVVYAPRRSGKKSAAREFVEELDREAMSPGEL
ncbi:glycosyltransferase [Microbacterium sp. X-17]|uniref:glycosyltransferase n=1 Tax=Microbacterium sp. X-17 TaxID=3144404 RepID=UPI0031F5D7C6